MKPKRIITIIGLSALIGIITYLFLLGKLFPFSPVIIGFEKHELPNTIVYIQKGMPSNNYGKIDTLIPAVEKFHDLKFLKKPKIFLFSDSMSYIHRSLSKARFCAYRNNRIFASPWALKESQSGKISLEIYLTHELSHSLIHQQLGLNAIRYPQWLLEGIAVYSSNQMGTSSYPSKEETYRFIQAGNFMPPDYFRTKKEKDIKLDFDNLENRATFMYSQFACIVDYLITIYGKDKFLIYMKSLTKNNGHNNIFKQVFGIDFDEFLIDFKEYVMNTEQ